MNKYSRLENFRHDTYEMLVKSKDATFELIELLRNKLNEKSNQITFALFCF